MKRCEGADGDCSSNAIRGERYCPICRDEMIRRMERDGYLTNLDEIDKPAREERRDKCHSRA